MLCVFGPTLEDRERASVYDLVASVSWEMDPLGQVAAPSGGGCFRRAALTEVGGYDARFRGGEETELGERLRSRGGRIMSVADRMATHRAGLRSWSGVFRRHYRAGESWVRLRRAGYPLSTRESTRPWVLVGVTIAAVAVALWTDSVLPVVCLGFLAVAAVGRLTVRYAKRGVGWERAMAAAVVNYLGMLPLLAGEAAEYCRRGDSGAASVDKWIITTAGGADEQAGTRPSKETGVLLGESQGGASALHRE